MSELVQLVQKYIEYLYKYDHFFCSSRVRIKKRNPFEIADDGAIVGFRYFDMVSITNGIYMMPPEQKNYTSWVYFGKIYSYDELMKKFGNDPGNRIEIERMKKEGYTRFCLCRDEIVRPMQDSDITYEQLMSSRKQTNRKK